MVSKGYIFDFLRDLRNNNSKEWMDENRSRYHKAKERWIEEVSLILKRLAQHDTAFSQVTPKDTLSRINNNRRFHPDKPVYKDYFSCDPDKTHKDVSLLHISVGPGGSFLGGGLWRPQKEALDQYRAAIDYNGEVFKEIVETPAVQDFYGGLAEDDQQLKTSPQSYSIDHPQIELLRYKNIVLMRQLTNAEVLSDSFVDLVEEAYLTARPFTQYLIKAVSFQEQ